MAPPPASSLAISDLSVCRFDQAYPLAKTALPNLGLAAWRSFLFAHLEQADSGLIAVENPRGVLLACAAYLARSDLRRGRYLEVDPVIVMDLVGAGAVAKALEEGLQHHAHRYGCSSMALQLPHRAQAAADDRAVSAFLGCGLSADSLRLYKRVETHHHAA
ncbi:MAG: hypothetical protein Kilf2KO_37630 [Rhodospirillales bacterium]